MAAKTMYEELLDAFSEEEINGLIRMIYGLATSFYEGLNLRNKISLDEQILDNCLVDILEDLARIKPFHKISRLNMTKIISYSAAWWVRRKPFQRLNATEKETLYINELFALILLLYVMDIMSQKIGFKEVQGDIKQIMYHLIYRNVNPQTLELLVVGYKMGRK